MSAVRRSAPLVFPARGKHTATVIFAHGLGDTGHGWASAVEHWSQKQKLDEVKFVLPHAPVVPITCNFGMHMPGWFDIKVLDGSIESLRANEDGPGVEVSEGYFKELIQAEVEAGIPSDRIVLGGFSQGGAMALYAGLRSPVKLGGVVGLSCWLVLSGKFIEEKDKREAGRGMKVFMGHGGADGLVPTALGHISSEMLKKEGYDVKLEVYPGMAHSACIEELDDVANYLIEQLPKQN